MVMVTVVLLVTPLLVPVMVIPTDPSDAVAGIIMLRVDVALPPEGGVTLEGMKAAVAPVGKPEAERATASLKPPFEVTVIVNVAFPPRTGLRTEGDAATVKSMTFRLTVVAWVAPPEVNVSTAM